VYDALGERGLAFDQWIARERMRGLTADQEESLRGARARGLQSGYSALVSAAQAGRPETGVPLALLSLHAGDADAAVAALLREGAPGDWWLVLYADRIPNLRPLRQRPELAQLFNRIEEFRASRQPSAV
jgi:hypothetical protein